MEIGARLHHLQLLSPGAGRCAEYYGRAYDMRVHADGPTGFAVLERDDGALAPPGGTHVPAALDARRVRVIPRDHRFVDAPDVGIAQVRDVTGTLGELFDRNRVRGVIVRPDRYVAACLSVAPDAGEADRLLEEIVQLSYVYPAAPESRQRLDAEIA